MDPVNPLAMFVGQGLTVIGLVMTLRKLSPKIDGLLVPLVAAVMSLLLVYAEWAIKGPFPGWSRYLGESILVWGAGVGSTTLLDRMGKNASDKTVSITTTPVVPPTVLVSAEDGAKIDAKTVVKVVGQ